jgi:ABC-2 type transport system ATP-binding protein
VARVVEAAERFGAIGAEIETDGRHVRGRVRRSGREVPGLLRDLDRSGIALESIEIVRPTLDDVFLALTGRSLREAQESGESGAAAADQAASAVGVVTTSTQGAQR